MERNIVISTGISGIRHEECWERLKKQLKCKCQTKSIERKMVEIEKRKNPYQNFRQILLYTPPSQQKLWREAFTEITDDINGEDTIFLTLHAVYYHQDKREFISPIDFELIRKLEGKAKMLIVLMDDIYDIYRRLMMNGEMYSGVLKLGELEALYSSIINLISLLQWRELEIAVSRIISGILRVPMFLVGTKHPSQVVARLIELPLKDLKLFYLSHPISTVRTAAITMLPTFTGELNLFVKKLIDNCSGIVLFLPGTIDELRIKKDGRQYLPELLPRWSLPDSSERFLFPDLPSEVKNVNPLNPLNYNVRSRVIRTSIHYLLRVLADHIDQQITSRDLTLVEQSKGGVIAYRPHFPNKLSGGVRRELEYNHKLSTEHKEKRRCSFVLSTVEELSKWRIRKFLGRVKMYTTLDESSKQKVDRILETWLKDHEKIETFSKPLLPNYSILQGELEKKVLPKNYEFQSDFITRYETTLPPGEIGKVEKERQRGFQVISSETQEDDLKNIINITRGEYNIWRQSEFEEKSREFIRNLCVVKDSRKEVK